MCSRARQAEGSANSRISPRNQPLMKQINWAAKWRDHIAQLKCKKKQPFLPFWGSLEENLGRDCHLDDLIKPRRSPKGHEIKLFLCWRPHLNVTSATQLGSWGNFQHQYTLQNVPGEELTLTPANLEHFAYQGKDLVWVFFVFSFIFRVVAFLSLTQLLGCQPKSDKKPGPQRFIHFFLHCWNAAKAKGSIRLLLQARRQWGKAAQHDPVLCVKPSTCLQKLMQWSCLLFISGIKCPGHVKMLWMRVLLGLVCILVSKCSLASRQPSTCKLV